MGLQVKTSNIPNAGNGLFATKEFKKDEKIDEYCGKKLNQQQFEHRSDEKTSYVLELKKGHYIDACRTNSCPARYANDPRGTKQPANADFKSNWDHTAVNVKANCKIQPGKEILVKYGQQYWTQKKPKKKEKQNWNCNWI